MLILLTIGEWRSARVVAVGGGNASPGPIVIHTEAARSAHIADVDAVEPSE